MKDWYCFGEFRRDPEITPDLMAEVLDQARDRAARQRQVPLEAMLEVLEEAGRRLADPRHPIRGEAMEHLPARVGFSPPMVAAALDTLCDILDGENLWRRLDCDLGDARCLDFYTYHERFQGYLRALPRGVVAHIAAGNVFVGALDSLVQGIVTKNANLLKMSGDDTFFPLLFARLLHECDPEGAVTGSFALLPFRGGRRDLEELIKTRCDVVIVYGGAEAVAAYRQGLGPHTKLVEYGPKYSLVVVTAAELARRGEQEVAAQVARDVTMWEQSACSSPHAVYVCAGEGEDPRGPARDFARHLAAALDELARTYPHGRILVDEQVEITRERELAKVAQTLGEAELIVPARHRQDWTVILEYDPGFHVSPHHRTVFVKPLGRLEELGPVLAPYGDFLQSVALVAAPEEALRLARELAWLGADRFTEPGHMSRRKHGTPHDGTRGTGELVRWASWGRDEPFLEEFDYLPRHRRDRITLARLNRLIAFCRRHSPFYRERLPRERLESLEQLAELPLLSPEDLRSHLPPEGEGLLTAPLENTYAFSSGGTTGQAKVVYRTVPETLYNARALAKGLRLAVFQPGDVVANLLFAGNLWASFVSFNQALELVGCHILPIAGSIGLEQVVEYLRRLKPNAAVSIPSVFLSLARLVEEQGMDDLRLAKIASGGEHLFPEARDYLRRVLGVEKFASTGYTTNDTGAIAFPCQCCEGGLHHVHEDLHWVEILDPHTHQPLPPGRVGKIVVTNLQRRLMPMIRYDVGDLGRILEEPCPCGRKVRLLELLGRVDEELRIGPARISLEMVSEKVGRVEGLGRHFRMIARREQMRDQLVVEVEAASALDQQQREQSARRLAEMLTQAKAEIALAVQREEIAPILVRVLPPETIPRNPRTGKIKQVVDQRQ
jgi:phenylacetate-coenzyme A ligase PaaK-like adenylate-forming protein